MPLKDEKYIYPCAPLEIKAEIVNVILSGAESKEWSYVLAEMMRKEYGCTFIVNSLIVHLDKSFIFSLVLL
jgi:hypothetical protein